MFCFPCTDSKACGRVRHLRHSASVHVVSAAVLDHLFGQVNVDSLLMKQRSQAPEQKGRVAQQAEETLVLSLTSSYLL